MDAITGIASDILRMEDVLDIPKLGGFTESLCCAEKQLNIGNPAKGMMQRCKNICHEIEAAKSC